MPEKTIIAEQEAGKQYGPLVLGRQGENRVTRIKYAYDPDWIGTEYSVEIYARRPREAAAYPVTYVTDDRGSGVVTWTVSAADTGIPGRGRMQIRFVSAGGEILKTESYDTETYSSIDTEVGDAPDVYETWLDALQELADATTSNAQAVETAKTAAQTAAANAAASAAASAAAVAAIAQAEPARVAAENARVEAEKARAEAEAARVTAESAREKASAEAVKNCEAATNTLLEQVNRIAFSLNSEDGGLDIIIYEGVA